MPQGEQPIAVVNWKYKWLWLVGWVCPTLGETYWWIVPRLNSQVFSQVLADFAQHFEVGAHKRVILAVDQASFHPGEEVQVPEGIHLLFLPPKSPELQPAERLWPLTNEAMTNRSFADLDELEQVMGDRCRVLLNRPELIRGLTNFYWWAEAVSQ